jgi:dipeptidyl aminopeptidase/acylaminoacyl peptidase
MRFAPLLATVGLFAFLNLLPGQNGPAPVKKDPHRPPAINTEHVPVVPAALWDRLRQYQNVRTATFAGWSPDSKGILITTQFGNTTQLHRVYTPGGRREQITFFDEPVKGRFLPRTKDGAILLSMSKGGNENYQVYLFEPATGKTTLVTDGKSRNELEAIDPDGKRMVIASNKRNGRDTDLYIVDPRQPDSLKMLLQTKGDFWNAMDWSHAGVPALLINRYVSINETYPAVLDIKTGTKTVLPIPGKGKVAFGDLAFGYGGLFVSTDARGEFLELARLPEGDPRNHRDFKGNYEWLTGNIPWNVTGIKVNPKLPVMAFTVNEDGASALYLLDDLPGKKPQRVKLPLGIVTGLRFSPDSMNLGFTLARPDAPADAYSIDLEDHQLTRWTYSEAGGLNPASFVTPQRIKFRSFDKLEVPAYYYQPRSAAAGKPAPVIVWIHGGPESQYRPIFSGLVQFFVNELGCAVLAPNVRGSAGYGKTYLTLDNAEKREDSVRDIGALLDWVATRPELDKSRVAVIGGSYGGYMVLGSLTNFPDRIKAGIDIVGIASFATFLKNTSGYRQDLRRAEYGDERDPKMQKVFARIDPIHNAHKIRSALLVVHGRNDPRVPFSEAEQIVAKVRDNGRPVWTVYADNEGHGFARRENRDYLNAVMALFLRENLK